MSLLLLLTAFTLGAAHAVAPDHLAAVGVFVSRARSTREALTHGARWGVGHALTLTLAGLAVLFAAGAWPQLLSLRAEWLVGVVLIALGTRTVWRALRASMPAPGHTSPHGHPAALSHDDAHARTHTHDDAHGHRHPLLGIGMLHGLAGSGAMAAMVPLGTGQHPWQAAVWLSLFGAGTIAAMALIAGAAGWSLRAATLRSTRWLRGVVALAGLASVGVGVLWLATTTW